MAQITDGSLRAIITERLQAAHVEVTDMSGVSPSSCQPGYGESQPRLGPRSTVSLTQHRTVPAGGCGQAFSVLIVSPQFQALSSLKRHRLVNAALKEEIASIHAWTARCQTPDEWERDKAKAGPSMEGTVGGQVDGTLE
ncbi:BolA domain-containing protein [Drechmeria coniospora]|uniref:BolA domain-containing protein n=1 Tax=Drechmeria coniospora TaxID=98403 RepID=A0A151GCG8_DRECN|nr:BolA domain-containing protein [Drechmeria coniospora]KYK54751.1 BolA domain-containing protein [Drechmeria coniospora]ODA76021.1 hypothetical protein RJ55_08303 [Drechmeria coniospora]